MTYIEALRRQAHIIRSRGFPISADYMLATAHRLVVDAVDTEQYCLGFVAGWQRRGYESRWHPVEWHRGYTEASRWRDE